MVEEADEPLIGLEPDQAMALARTNLIEKWVQYRLGEETMGVVAMYERAALEVGLGQDECDAICDRTRRED